VRDTGAAIAFRCNICGGDCTAPAAALQREAAGFVSTRFFDEPYLPYGIVWPEPWSVPVVTRARCGDAEIEPPPARGAA
jgi:hypothetical protein